MTGEYRASESRAAGGGVRGLAGRPTCCCATAMSSPTERAPCLDLAGIAVRDVEGQRAATRRPAERAVHDGCRDAHRRRRRRHRRRGDRRRGAGRKGRCSPRSSAGKAVVHRERGAAADARPELRTRPSAAASTCTSRRRSPAGSRSSARCASRSPGTRMRRCSASSTAPATTSSAHGRTGAASPRRWPRRARSATPRPIPPPTSRATTPRPRPRSSPLAFHTRVPPTTSTARASPGHHADFGRARARATSIKLLAICERIINDEGQQRISARVHPAMVPPHHPLAAVNGANNAVFVEAEAGGRLMFYGRGAGGAPTASAVLGDLVGAARTAGSGGARRGGVEYGERRSAGRRDVQALLGPLEGRRPAGRARQDRASSARRVSASSISPSWRAWRRERR